MPSALSLEAFLPCLLDRLCDDEPDREVESLYRQSLTLPHYRKSVLRDLRWLLNTPAPAGEVFNDAPEVQDSVLNYGTPDLCGRIASSLNTTELEAQIAQSIARFEPRIVRGTLSVKMIPKVNANSPNLIAFEIRGTMWANPLPEEFVLETQLDLETGQCDF